MYGGDVNRDRIISAVITVAVLGALLLMAVRREPETTKVAETTPTSADSVTAPLTAPGPPPPTFSGSVGKNTSFFDLMLACGITPQEIREIARKTKKVYDFRRIYPGQKYELFTDEDGQLAHLTFTINEDSFVEVRRDSSGVIAERKRFPYETEIKIASGLITQSLYVTIQEQGLAPDLLGRITDIYAWDIDFFRDIQKNDYFRVIYEEHTRSDTGAKRVGNIIAAEFNTRGKSHYAVLFENEPDLPDYFDDTGRSLRKQLLKAPLSYTRVSSAFSRRRYHPVLHRYTPHYGIDYAAPVGTPVMATGNGTVLVAGYRRGNGNYVKIRHNSNYITYYLHLSRFAKGIRKGAKVNQGQVIGYVGATGYATGPHLDYRVKKNGRFVNPRRLKLPPAQPVSKENMASFLVLKETMIAELHQISIKDSRTQYFTDSGKPEPTIKNTPGDDDAFLVNPLAH
jgi:murein DD-endopeptidase MepM/ murein hydrolase activator NlpD